MTIILEPKNKFENAIFKRYKNGKIVYSYPKLIEVFMKDDGMTYDESVEWIDFNILCLPGIAICFDSPLIKLPPNDSTRQNSGRNRLPK